MRKSVLFIMIITVTVAMWIFSAGEMTGIFPRMEGWAAKGKVETYAPDNLYEYINGAAEVFLSYDFQKLATLTYENKQKNSFTVDVYRHSSGSNGFGIYSQERPDQGEFLTIGTEGYYETGVLNFFKDLYYVKISSFDLGENDRAVLTEVARLIAGKLEGQSAFPAVLHCFPPKSKVAHSERYVARNFLGHNFLHSAFTADYAVNEQKIQVFIMEAEDETEAGDIVKNYRDFVEKRGIEVTDSGGVLRFSDPYYRSSGPMNMKRSGRYVWGLFHADRNLADSLIETIGHNLKKSQLIK
jgi:hypothetical protein